MNVRKAVRALAAVVLGVALGTGSASAAMWDGTLYYTNFTGGVNVNKIDYSYDDSTNTFSLSGGAGVAAAVGADGIIFAPNGNLLIGGQCSGQVHEYTTAGGFVGDAPGNDGCLFHETLGPDSRVYTSDFGGPLVRIPLNGSGGVAGQSGTVIPVVGTDAGVTQIAFAPNGNVFYVNGAPNGFGNVGLIDLTTAPAFVTTARIYSGIEPAHGLIYDPYTGLMTMFGAGRTGTFMTDGTGLKVSAGDFTCDFDQGAVDGAGHALVAGCGAITFLDYRASGDITAPDYFTVVGGFGGIDDVAPLVGLGAAPVPEPATLVLVGLGLVGFGVARYRRRA